MAVIVSQVAIDVLRQAERERRQAAAGYRMNFLSGHFSVHDRLARELETEADALDKAVAVLEALQLQ